jgi:hypothetical protein
MVKRIHCPGIDCMALFTVQRPDEYMIRPHTRSVDTIVAVLTGLGAYCAVVEKRCGTDSKTGRRVAAFTGRRGDDMVCRLAYGEYIIVAFLTLNGKFFKKATDVTLLALQIIVLPIQWKTGFQVVKNVRGYRWRLSC